ncbi:MAG: M3 family oligoendopeptidase [Planctomycetota bacterium]|nr:M3 family oligoendopeptidase [Planctomycetota bacterium]
MVATAYPRRFVPKELDAADFSQLEKHYRELMDRAVSSVEELKKWLLDFSELSSVVDEYGSRCYINKSCHTEDAEIKKRYFHFVENVEPKVKPLAFALQKKYLESPYRKQLEGTRYAVLDRKWQADVELFREANIPIETEVIKKVSEYDEINGRMMVTIGGKELTLQQAARFLEFPDRPARQEAWEATSARRLADREQIETIYDALLPLRQQIATNAGLSDYRAFQWKANKRFDYTPEDCLRFADAIAETCVPVVRRLDEQRAADLGLKKLRPWDLSVDPQGRAPLKPFEETQIEDFVGKTREIFNRLSPALAGDFDQLRARGNLDLQSRKGKQPGGYLMPLEESRQPFIFMNAAGLQRDVQTLLHEGGHAFHHLAAANEDLVFLRSAPMEFCEVASMAMELLGSEHLGVFYNAADSARARRTLIEGIIRFLPWMAIIDSFQHWIYTHPGHHRQEREKHWISLLDRFSSKTDWTGWEQVRSTLWQRQGHLFHAPFYYIEYGIAQLGALQLWMKAKHDPRAALANYRAALALGGTKPLPQLFSAAGIVFDFSQKTLGPVMKAMEQELEELPR